MKNINFKMLKEKLQYGLEMFVLRIFVILLYPFTSYYRKKMEKFSSKKPGDVEIVFNEDWEIGDETLPYKDSPEYNDMNSEIKKVFKKYFDKYELSEDFNPDDEKISLVMNSLVDLEYDYKNFFGMTKRYIRPCSYSNCVVIKSDFPYKQEMFDEISPLYKKLGEFLSDYKFTYYKEHRDLNGTLSVGLF